MMTLERQLEAIGDSLETHYGPIEASEILHQQASPAARLRGPRRRGVFIAVAAALGVILIVGVTPFLIQNGDRESPPASVPATSATTSPPTADASTTESTVVAEPGAALTFTEAALPGGSRLMGWSNQGSAYEEPSSAASWIKDRFYVVATDGIYSTTDGVTWVMELPVVWDDSIQQIALGSDGTKPIVAMIPIPDNRQESCGWITPERILTEVKDPSGAWVRSEIALPFDDEHCLGFWLGSITAGPAGYLVTGFINKEEGNRSYAVTGREQSYFWWSKDGQDWTSLEGPIVERVFSAVATDADLYAAAGPDGDPADFIVYAGPVSQSACVNSQLAHPGQPCVQLAEAGPVFRWRDQIVHLDFGESDSEVTVRLWEPPRTVLVAENEDLGSRIYLGEMGVLRGASESAPGPYISTSAPIHFSSDGQTWMTWVASELSTLGEHARVVGMGEDFLVLTNAGGDRILVGTPTQ